MDDILQINVGDTVELPFGMTGCQPSSGLFIEVDHFCVDAAGNVIEIGWTEAPTAADPSRDDRSLEAEVFRRAAMVLKARYAGRIIQHVEGYQDRYYGRANAFAG